MGRIAVVGEPARVDVWALAGALVLPVTGADGAGAAWETLPPDVEVVIATPEAARALGDRASERLVVVLP